MKTFLKRLKTQKNKKTCKSVHDKNVHLIPRSGNTVVMADEGVK